jgi:hypothetical protein
LRSQWNCTTNGPGARRANYDQLLQQLGVSPEGRHPDPDCLFHWIAEAPGGGLRVTDVWTSQAQFDEFVHDTIAPIAQQLGIPDPHPVKRRPSCQLPGGWKLATPPAVRARSAAAL